MRVENKIGFMALAIFMGFIGLVVMVFVILGGQIAQEDLERENCMIPTIVAVAVGSRDVEILNQIQVLCTKQSCVDSMSQIIKSSIEDTNKKISETTQMCEEKFGVFDSEERSNNG